jgi:hypothetical protein
MSHDPPTIVALTIHLREQYSILSPVAMDLHMADENNTKSLYTFYAAS